MEFGGRVNTPIAPVNTPQNLPADPQFQDRFEWLPSSELGAEQLGFPVNFVGEGLPHPAKAPTVGQHTDEVLKSVCGYDDTEIQSLRDAGTLG
jgi:crotonobetainyl-CoA:carnitine CoA-transferase CaiB-like acyl-CoA transferase